MNITTEVIRTSFPHLTESEEGRKRLQEFIPTYGVDYRLPANSEKFADLQRKAKVALQLV